MEVLQTPDSCFEGLPGYPFAPHYAEIDGEEAGRVRMHYVEEGPAGGRVLLMLHGQPTWSYLYRHMIAAAAEAGYRAIAPDLIGFGRSDKPAEIAYYSYDRHVAQVCRFVEALDLRDAHLFCHDWGGFIGLRVGAETPERFASLTISNTGLPKCKGGPISDSLALWFAFCDQHYPDMPVGEVISMGTITSPPPEVIAAYEAPFPSVAHKAGPVVFPKLVPLAPDSPGAEGVGRAWQALEAWEKPFTTLFGDSDPLNSGTEQVFWDRVPGAKGRVHAVIKGGHFIQEDAGAELTAKTIEVLRSLD